MIARFHFLFRPSLPALIFALRTTATALAALVIAVLLGLDSPHWAAMTVWIVAQPTRGMVISKGLYRLAGTVMGSLAAAAIIVLFGHAPLALAMALAVWVGLCAAASTLLRGFRAYGAVLAGYSAALVAIIGLGHHDDITGIALARVAEVALGIVVSGAVTSLFLPGSGARDLLVRTRVLCRDTLDWAGQSLIAEAGPDSIARQHRLLSEIAQINAQGDLAAAGSRDLSLRVAHARSLIAALLTLMAQMRARAARPQADSALLGTALRQTAASLSKTSLAFFAPWPDIAVSLGTVMGSYRALARQPETPPTAIPHPPHADWKAARLAGLRAFGGVAAAGMFWAVTGWGDGPPMLMAAAIMGSVFASTDTPSRNVLMAMKGSALAVIAATACALLLGHGTAPLPLAIALTAPFLVLAGLAVSNRATLIPGTDFAMLFLLLGQPGVALRPTPEQLLDMGIGILCGMALAALVNRLGQPADSAARLDALSAEIVRDLHLLARSAPGKGSKWRTKAFHRVLRLVLKANEAGGDPSGRLEGALSALNVGMGINRLRAVLHHATLPEERHRGVRAVLDSAALLLPRQPEHLAALALAEAERHGDDAIQREAAAGLREMADALIARPAFFKVSG